MASDERLIDALHPDSLLSLVEKAGGRYLTGGGAAFTSIALEKFVALAIEHLAGQGELPAELSVAAKLLDDLNGSVETIHPNYGGGFFMTPDVFSNLQEFLTAPQPTGATENRIDRLETELAQARAAVPEGWKLVPEEMTYQMLKAMGPDTQLGADGLPLGSIANRKRWVAILAAAPNPPAAEAPFVEVWKGARKVTIYIGENVLRSWGPNIETEMSEEPYSYKAVGDAMDWLYASPVAPEAATPSEPPARNAELTGDQARAIVRSAATSSSDSPSPVELVAAGWRAALATASSADARDGARWRAVEEMIEAATGHEGERFMLGFYDPKREVFMGECFNYAECVDAAIAAAQAPRSST